MANGYWTNHGQLTEAELAAVQLAVANGIATYAAGEIENLAGVPATLTDLLANAQLNCYPRGFVLAASDGMGLPMVAAAAAYVKDTGYVVSNPSSTIMNIDQATGIAHGMGAGSEGKYLWIRTSAGVPTGFYEITDRSVSDEINVDVGASSGLIGTTVIEAISLVSTYAPIAVVQIPGGVMGPGGKLEFDIAAVCTNSANYKYVRAVVDTDSVGAGGTQAGESGVTTTYGIRPPIPAVMLNTGATNAQVMFGYSTSISGAVPTETIDTDANFYVSLQAKCTAVDEYIRLAWSVNLTPGA